MSKNIRTRALPDPQGSRPARASLWLALAAASLFLASHRAEAAGEYGRVISSTAVQAQVPVPQQQCYDSQQVVEQPRSGGGALVGAVIGGVLGNAIGAGAGRAAATGLGVVAGAALGDQAEANANPPSTRTVRSCQTVSRMETRVIGYDVVYEYQGQRYSARLAQPPGERIALAVNVAPSGALAADAAAYAQQAPATAPEPVYAPAYPASPAYPAPVYAPDYPVYAPVYAPAYGYGHGYGYGYPAAGLVVTPRIIIGGGRYRDRWH